MDEVISRLPERIHRAEVARQMGICEKRVLELERQGIGKIMHAMQKMRVKT